MTRMIAISYLAFFAMGVSTPTAAVTPEAAAEAFEGMTWYTEEYPPYNFAGVDGLPTGMSIEILIAAFEKIGVDLGPADIKLVPWSRSYKYVQTKPGTALFSMTITPEREKLVKFVGPAIPLTHSIIAPVKNNVVIRKPSDLNQFKIGVVKDDAGDLLLQKLNIRPEVIRRITTPDQLVALIESGKVDVVAYSVDVFASTVKKAGGDPRKYEGVHVLKEAQAGYAFHISTDSAVLAYLQRAIDEMRSDGTIDRIIGSYSRY